MSENKTVTAPAEEPKVRYGRRTSVKKIGQKSLWEKLFKRKKKKGSEEEDIADAVASTTTDLFDDDFEKAAVYCDNVVKIYKTEDVEVIALQGLDLRIDPGEIVAIIGNSGSGKSTLMNIIGGLDKQTAGMVYVTGNNMAKMTEAQIVQYKRKEVGFVWQNNARNLIPYLSALENVRTARKEKRERRCFWIWWDSLTATRASSISFPAANSSASPSPSPWQTSRRSCWPTNRPAPWTTRPRI